MDLIEKIKSCQTMKQLDDLRDEIAIAGQYGEIPDFPYLKAVFMEKKKELEGKENGFKQTIRNAKKTRR